MAGWLGKPYPPQCTFCALDFFVALQFQSGLVGGFDRADEQGVLQNLFVLYVPHLHFVDEFFESFDLSRLVEALGVLYAVEGPGA